MKSTQEKKVVSANHKEQKNRKQMEQRIIGEGVGSQQTNR